MKTLKTVLTIALSTVGLGSAVALGVSSGSNVKFLSASATAPTNTRRIWILNNDNWWTDNNYWVYAWNDNGNYGSSSTTKINMVLPSYYHGLGYADITLTDAANSLKVRIVNSWGDYGQTVVLNLPALGGEDVIWMNSGGTYDSTEKRNDRNASLGATNGFNGSEFTTLLNEYDTCSSANTNGYNAYPQVKKVFADPTNDSSAFTAVVKNSYTVQDYLDAMSTRYTNQSV